MRALCTSLFLCAAAPLSAQDVDIQNIVAGHVLPGYQALAEDTQDLAMRSAATCDPNDAELIQTYHRAFDAWVGVSHLRFGPSEEDDRAFALAFWPDPRGSTPKTLSALIRSEDPAVADPEDFGTLSVAARGFYALEFLLFDPRFLDSANPAYTCALTRAVTRDIAANAAAILQDWQIGYADLMTTPGNDTYRTATEATQQLFTALMTGLEFTSDTRLGRPMGTFERPRPNRAEARRSNRSLRHVVLSLQATRTLAEPISSANDTVDQAYQAAITRAQSLEDPTFASVATQQGRLDIELLQQDIDRIRTLLAEEVGPALGIAAGFNALDGD